VIVDEVAELGAGDESATLVETVNMRGK